MSYHTYNKHFLCHYNNHIFLFIYNIQGGLSMKTILSQLFLPYLSKIGFVFTENLHDKKCCGLCYELDPSVGTGYYWVYPVNNLYAITIFDLFIKSDISFQYKHPPFLCLGSYKTSHTKQFSDRKVNNTEHLLGYAGHQSVYQLTINKNVYISSVGISLTPKFYEDFLPNRYPGNFQNLIHIFSKINGDKIIPELTTILNQVRSFKPSSEIANMYYESKVLELLSLVLHWEENQHSFNNSNRIPDWEKEQLNKIITYISFNYKNSISLDTLTKISCMSHNKLTNSFKQVYGLTITEYIQSIRINRAKEMLLNSNWRIGEIANEVGYKLHGSFSEIFKRTTGFTPIQFRKNSH